MKITDYKSDNEAASGLAKVTNTVGRVLMSPINKWNSMAYYNRDEARDAAWVIGGLGFIAAACFGSWTLAENHAAKRESAILKEMDKIQCDQVFELGNGQYGATEMSAEDSAALRAQAEKVLTDTRATSNWKTVCFDMEPSSVIKSNF